MKRVIFLTLLSCSEYDGLPDLFFDEQVNPCTSPGAFYTSRYSKENGTCPLSPPEVADTSRCFPGPYSRNEGCVRYVDSRCISIDGTKTYLSGMLTWSRNGSTASGEVTVSSPGTNQPCVSTYAVSVTKL